MKFFLIFIIQFLSAILFGQNSSNILKITIPDSIIHIKSKFYDVSKLPESRVFLKDYEYCFIGNIIFENLTDTTLNLYYVYNNVYPSYYFKEKLDSSIFLNDVPTFEYRRNVNGEFEQVFNNFMGFRFVIFNSKNDVIHGISSLNFIDYWDENLKYTKIEKKLDEIIKCNNTKRLKFAKPLIIKKHSKNKSKYKFWVIKRNSKYPRVARLGRLHLLMPYILDEAVFMGLDKGTYYLYLYYWVNLDPILCGPDYVSLQYPTKIDKDKTKHDFILSDISKRKVGIPFKGYIKSNSVKLIVE